MQTILIGKPIHDATSEAQSTSRTLVRMEDGGWFSPPLGLESIPKPFDIFNGVRDDRLRHVYAILIARAIPMGGVTKLWNSRIAEEVGCTTHQVSILIKKLQKLGVIAVSNDFYQTETRKPRNCRTIMVWAAFYIARCQVSPKVWRNQKNSIRYGITRFKKAIELIPLKYKISAEVEVKSQGRTIVVKPVRTDLDTLVVYRVIDSWMYDKILYYTEMEAHGFTPPAFQVAK